MSIKVPQKEQILDLLREISETEILPWFQNLSEKHISEKGAGQIVTVVDTAVEKALTPKLETLVPGSMVVGEEGVHDNPKLLDALDSDHPVWIVDPIDGTRGFSKGKNSFCVILALAYKNEVISGYVYQPIDDRLTMAEKGAGAYCDDQRLDAERSLSMGQLNTAVYVNHIPKKHRTALEQRIGQIGPRAETTMCAGLEYERAALGQMDATVFWTTHPWDHAAGARIIEEAGGISRYIEDGETYRPAIRDRKGLLVVGQPEHWSTIAETLFPEIRKKGK